MSIRKWTWRVGVLAAALLAPSAALAQGVTVGGDEVVLKNGGLLRGTVVSMDPGKEVVIQIQGVGETRRVPWTEVDHVNRDAAVSVTTAVPVVPVLPPPVPGEVGAPRIHIESDQPVSLREATVTLDGLRRPIACRAPCDAVVDGRTGRSFFFTGDEVPESSRFLLNEKSGDVTVRVSTGSDGLRTGGSVFLTLGILGASAGTVMLPLGLALNAAGDTSGPHGTPALSSSSPLPLVGGVMLGTGLAVLTTGIVMKVLGNTRYEWRPGRPVPRVAVEPGVIRF